MLLLFGVSPPRTNTSSSSLAGGKPEAALNSEPLLTDLAGERLLLGVTPLVLADLGGKSEGLGTELTFVLLLNPSLLSLVTGC